MKLQAGLKFSLAALIVLSLSTLARADRKAELADRFAARADAIRRDKDAGKVGETTQGLIEAVNAADASDAGLKNLVTEENTDRQELYALIAKDQGTDVATVTDRAAHRNFDKAKPGDYLKTAAGEWKRK